MRPAPLLALLASTTIAHGEAPVVPGLANRDDLGSRLSGSVLLSELSCTACHAAPDASPKGGPKLEAVAARVQRDHLEAFIADPAATKPGTTMPNMLHALPEAERTDAAAAIADYLASLTEGQPKLEPVDAEAVTRGKESFHRVGCVACHSPEGKSIPGSPPLHRLEEKYSLASLTAFLEDPLAVRPAGRMPDLGLDHFEAVDIASYLLREQKVKATPARKAARAEEGRALFQKHGCAQCHSPGERQPEFAQPLAKLNGSAPCTSAQLPLSETQRRQIGAAAIHNPRGIGTEVATDEIPIALELTRLNCIACHQRGGQGGVTPERDPYFTTANLNLGPQARIPPTLDGVGAKLDPKWLRKVLVAGASARPYIHTRMPKFGPGNVEKLLAEFPKRDVLEPAEFERVADEKEARNAGHQLAGNKNLSCVACHTWKGESATTLTALDLTTMAERLQENWFHHYMRDPQRLSPGTIMPGFWPGGKAVRPELLDGDPGKQIDALWQYLARGREARTPAGIKREPIHYGPTAERAVVLRRQYRGIGKRGIGVGYPGGINLAFDAAQLRLGSIWAGDFGEMSGIWRGQGSGNVNEGSREVVRFPLGPAFANLTIGNREWPQLEINKRAEGFAFKGYSLDAKGRPTFRYTFGELAIEDGFVDSPDGPSLTRSITFDKPAPNGLHLKLAADKELKHTGEGNRYQLSHGLTIEAPPSSFVIPGDIPQLIAPLGEKKSATITYRFKAK